MASRTLELYGAVPVVARCRSPEVEALDRLIAQVPGQFETADSELYIRVGSEMLSAAARPLRIDERASFWPALVAEYPMFGDYQSATNREIPVVALDPRRPAREVPLWHRFDGAEHCD